ncbi:MAG: hypothetical protein L6R40_003193 [Gallowayella cf. fulva]|nr:MAG: hypothetical protein L6R40_003193 [Xanthomendoza cf. fulva]
MILTLKPTALQNGYASSHAYSPIQQPPKQPPPTSFSPTFKSTATLPSLSGSSPRKMSTPHRGLPPPSAMTLPNPDRGPSSTTLSIGQLPAAPSQWHGAEESMRNWLQAKSEEERRKQEEQKTQQESLKLEQRKVEQNILRESLQGGIPPYMVPMVFAGMGGGPLPNVALEWAQHAMASITLQQQAQIQQQQQIQQQPQQQQQQQQQPPPTQSSTQTSNDQRRVIAGPQPNPYGPQQMQQPPPGASPQTQPNMGFVPSYQNSNTPLDRARLPGPPTSSRGQSSSTLPRLNTVEMQVQPPSQPLAGLQLPAQHPIQQAQNSQQQEQPVSSPIYFHHYVPPNTQSSSNKDPGTPTVKSQHESPFSQTQSSYLRSDYAHSPKKRKATGAHQAAPPPSSGPPETSPSFSHTSSGSASGRRRGRSRQQSDASSRAVHDPSGARHHRSRTESGRQSVSEAESGSQRHNSAQPETRSSHQQQHHPAGPATRREPQERNDRNSPKEEREASS